MVKIIKALVSTQVASSHEIRNLSGTTGDFSDSALDVAFRIVSVKFIIVSVVESIFSKINLTPEFLGIGFFFFLQIVV